MSNETYTPVQELPENQDPSVAYILDEVTGVKTPLLVEKGSVVDAAPKKKRGRPPKQRELGTAVEAEEPAEDDEE